MNYNQISRKFFYCEKNGKICDLLQPHLDEISNHQINKFYLKLKNKYIDRKNSVFFHEFIENLCLTELINPNYFTECYNNKCIYLIENVKKYSDKFEDIFNIANESIKYSIL